MSDAEHYREHGYLHAPAVFDTGEVDELRAAIERILDDVAGTSFDAEPHLAGGRAGRGPQGLPQRAIPRRCLHARRCAAAPRVDPDGR